MFRAIAFDLDDTLLDTTGLLVPRASDSSFQILIDAGLKLSLEECQKRRLQLIKSISHKEVFQKLAYDHGTEQTKLVVDKAIQAFYEPEIPSHLPLLHGARENIDYLKKKYDLYLVTAGNEKTQNEKARALGVKSDFKKIFVTNSLKKERKENAFLQILALVQCEKHELLCIGNSLTSEIYDALKIGAKACYFEFGEERGPMPTNREEQPQFHIRHHSELIRACHL